MIITGKPVDPKIASIHKSISDNLKNSNIFESDTKDTAENSVELKPPIPMNDCLYIFENSSHVANCCRILASDLIYNDITLTYDGLDEPTEHQINQINKINEYLVSQIDEIFYTAVDYHYAGWGAVEYVWNNTRFKLRQIPIHTCKIIRVNLNGEPVYLLHQKINSKNNYFKIMGETYPEDFLYYNKQKLGYASLIGGDNIYQFFSLPRWIQSYPKILTEIAISNNDYKTISNGNISGGVLNVNLEPQITKPIQYDAEGKPIPQKSREEIISEELSGANSGTAVIFTESNRPVNLDYVALTNNNSSYLLDLGETCQRAVLNDYNIPNIRLMINTDKESMNSDKSKSLWEIYTLNLKNEQKKWIIFIKELLYELYSLPVKVEISTPIFSDRRETETQLIINAWDTGALTLKQLITGLSEYITVIDLNEYDFTANPDLWSYRKIDYEPGLSEDDLAVIESVEAQLKGI